MTPWRPYDLHTHWLIWLCLHSLKYLVISSWVCFRNDFWWNKWVFFFVVFQPTECWSMSVPCQVCAQISCFLVAEKKLKDGHCQILKEWRYSILGRWTWNLILSGNVWEFPYYPKSLIILHLSAAMIQCFTTCSIVNSLIQTTIIS